MSVKLSTVQDTFIPTSHMGQSNPMAGRQSILRNIKIGHSTDGVKPMGKVIVWAA